VIAAGSVTMSAGCPCTPATLAAMTTPPPLASIAAAFFDSRSGLSALAVQHLRTDGRAVIVFHDAPGPAAAHPLLSGIAEALGTELTAGQTLTLVETSMPEHPVETFIYARLVLGRVPDATSAHVVETGDRQPVGRLSARGGAVLSAAAVARLCGITVMELGRTEHLVVGVHQPRSCAFPGFRQLPLGVRDRVMRAAA
jgi:hypothetical protein